MNDTLWSLDAITKVGIPMFLLIAVGLAIWRILVWVGREMILPVRDKLLAKAVDVLDRVDSTLKVLEGHVGKATATLEKSVAALDRIEATNARVRDSLETLAAAQLKGAGK